jgi:hypothetical protein
MATRVSKFQVPGGPVSITDGTHQVQFDTPADLVDYLDLNPQAVARIAQFSWTTAPVVSDN